VRAGDLNELGYGALALILEELSSGEYAGVITRRVRMALAEVLSVDKAWAVAGILQDSLGPIEARRGEEGVLARTSPFAAPQPDGPKSQPDGQKSGQAERPER
jgi:hypothetical protein